MRHLLFLGFFLNIGCFDFLKDTEEDEDDEENQNFFEGDQYGDCFDEEDNDEDGLIDCDDPGCAEKPACQDDIDTDNPEDTGDIVDTGDTDDTQDTGEVEESIGEAIVSNTCNNCHGTGAPSFADVIPNITDQRILDVMENGSGYMPPTGLMEEEMLEVLAYLRETYGDGPEIQAEAAFIFTAHCTGCHSGGLVPNLNDDLCSSLVGVASQQVPSMNYVTPGDLSSSYLWHKLNGTAADVGGAGSIMPITGGLPAEDLQTIGSWISSGVDCQ